MKKLNVGCGNDIREGYTNLDAAHLPGVNVVHNLAKFPYPFKDNTFDEIVCRHVLEHIEDTDRIMKEFNRILKPGGILKITVPHFTSSGAWTDPQHKRPFGYFSFDYYIKEGIRYEAAKWYQHEHACKFKRIVKEKLIFGKTIQIWNWIIEPIANRFPYIYEDSFIRSFPVLELYVELEK